MEIVEIDFKAKELIDRVLKHYKYEDIETLALKHNISFHKINVWLEDNDVDAIIDFCEEQGISKYIVNSNNNTKLLRKKNTVDIAIENLIKYFQINSIMELRKILEVKEKTILDWRNQNKIGELVEAVNKKRKDALAFMFKKEDSCLK